MIFVWTSYDLAGCCRIQSQSLTANTTRTNKLLHGGFHIVVLVDVLALSRLIVVNVA